MKTLYLCIKLSLTNRTAMSNDIGKIGERIFTVLIGRYFDQQGYLFDPIFLGDKYPTVDFYVDLLNNQDEKGFFFVSVKTTIQGYSADKKKLKIKANGKEFSYNELPELDKEWLFILDKGVLQIQWDDALQKGKAYDVEFKYDLYIPYVLVGPQADPLMASSLVHKKLICQ